MQSGIYRHYKGDYYQVLCVAAHSETEEEMVVYVSLDATLPGPRVRVRPRHGRKGFETTELVHNGKVYENIQRFVYVGDSVCG